jgi:hypothetical protein
LIGVRPRAFDAQRLCGPLCEAFMPVRPGAVQCLGEAGLRLLEEPTTYRLYYCCRCGMQVCICARCDHGNLYCGGMCARLARRESLRRAGARYQRTLAGSSRHAQRQRRYRARREAMMKEVTQHGFSSVAAARSVSAHLVTVSESIDVGCRDSPRRLSCASHTRCAFCDTVLPAFARLHPWRWSG